jgi:hypothetical protein
MRQRTVALVAVLASLAACVSLRHASPDDPVDAEPDAATEDGERADGALPSAPDASAQERDLEWAMWPLPASSPVAGDYSVTEGTVHDDRTGLDWERAAPASSSTWAEARARCEALVLEAHDDWRLATRIELLSLVDYGRAAPSLHAAVFSEGSEAGVYWSSTPDARDPVSAWSVSFGLGESLAASTESERRSRCVRGEPVARAHYEIDGDVVIDLWTGLAWQRRLASAAPVAFTDALLLCQGARTGDRSGWRLPTARELESIVDVRATSTPTLRADVFASEANGSTLWSITKVFGSSPARSWAIDFTPEHAPTSLETGADASSAVRCVAEP